MASLRCACLAGSQQIFTPELEGIGVGRVMRFRVAARATGRPLVLGLVLLAGGPAAAAAQVSLDATAAEMYGAWCARCHAEDGSGRVDGLELRATPLDFGDCRLATPEPDADWNLVIALGGPAAGLSSEMPSFGDALSDAQIAALTAHLRSFCDEPGWPHGNLNFPRPIFTEKAFPENEVVLLPAIAHGDDGPDLRVRTVYERRFGRRGHAEIGVPAQSLRSGGERRGGIGDVTLAVKAPFLVDAAALRILTAGFEASLPTGSESRGLGAGTTVLEPYLAAGQLWRDTYVQAQLKLEVPWRGGLGEGHLVYNLYAGRDLAGTPDTWTIGVEINGEDDEVALTPQARKGLTRTGALAASVGVRIPVVNRQEQHIQWVGYLLWEYLDPVRAAR